MVEDSLEAPRSLEEVVDPGLQSAVASISSGGPVAEGPAEQRHARSPCSRF